MPLEPRFKDDANDDRQVLLDRIVLNGTPCGTLWFLLHMAGLVSGSGQTSQGGVGGYFEALPDIPRRTELRLVVLWVDGQVKEFGLGRWIRRFLGER